VTKDKVASLAFGNPEDAFGQKRAGAIFRESWYFGWLKKNAPDVAFKVYALPCAKACPGGGQPLPVEQISSTEQPPQADRVGFLRFISKCQGRPRAASAPGAS